MPTLICRSLKYEIYKEALKIYKREECIGMCRPLDSACNLVSDDISIYDEKYNRLFKEFYLQKPTPTFDLIWWFHPCNRQARINTLNICIRLTKPIKP